MHISRISQFEKFGALYAYAYVCLTWREASESASMLLSTSWAVGAYLFNVDVRAEILRKPPSASINHVCAAQPQF